MQYSHSSGKNVQFFPYLGFQEQLYRKSQHDSKEKQSKNLFAKTVKCKTKKAIYIGLLDIKQENFKFVFPNFYLNKPKIKDVPILYLSQAIQQSDKTPVRYLYLSNQKSQTQHHNLLASILITFSSSVIYQFNSKYVRTNKTFTGGLLLLKQLHLENTVRNQFVLISQKDKPDVYKINISQSSRMEIKQKISSPVNIIKQLLCQDKSGQQSLMLIKPIEIDLLQVIFEFYYFKQMHLFEDKNTTFLGQLVFLTYTFFLKLQKQSKFYRHIIQNQHNHQNQKNVLFFTFQNFESLQASLIKFKNGIPITEEKGIDRKIICQTAYRTISSQIQLFKENSLIKILQNLQNQHFSIIENKELAQGEKPVNFLLQYEQLKIQQQLLSKKLCANNINPQFLSIITKKYQTSLMSNYIKTLEKSLSKQQLKISQNQNQLVQRQIKINFQQAQLQEQSKRNFLLKQISQQLQIMEQRLGQANTDKRKLKIDIESYLNEIKQSKQREVRLQGINNAYKQEKSNMLQAIGKLTKQNLQYLAQIKQGKSKIEELQQKNSNYRHIQRIIIKEQEKNATLQQNLNEFKKYHEELQKDLSTFKKRQVDKFNFILSQNWKQYQKQMQKNQRLTAKIQSIQSKLLEQQKEKKVIQAQIDYFQKMYYQKCCNTNVALNQRTCSRQNILANHPKMSAIFESMQQDFTTDRQKQGQKAVVAHKALQNHIKKQQLVVINY